MKESSNRQRGNTLSLIVTCALFIVVIGLGIDFLLMIFKGHRRLTNTADAIALELAKNIIKSPKVRLNPGFEMDNWGPLSDNGWIDLYRFNKIVAQVILSAANAAADGSPASISAANDLIEHLQGMPSGEGGAVTGRSSLAARLRAELIKAATDFSSGGDIDIQISRDGDSLLAPAYADPSPGGNIGQANASGTGVSSSQGYAFGHAGAPANRNATVTSSSGNSGNSGSSGFSFGFSSGNGGFGVMGSTDDGPSTGNGGWHHPTNWTVNFGTTSPPPGTTTYQSYAGGTASPEKAAFLAGQQFVSWVDRQSPSNIIINPLSMPIVTTDPNNITPANRIAMNNPAINVNGEAYVPGYVELTLRNGAARDINVLAAVPMRVGDQPHLISTREFEPNTNGNFIRAVTPPNAYKYVATTLDRNGHRNMIIADAQVSSGQNRFRAAFDYGYIEIINMGDRGGYDYNGDATTTTNVFSKELMSGIWLGNNGAFSTDRQALLDWAAYNAGTGPRPQLYDNNGNLRVHGNTATITGLLPSAPGGTRQNGPCMWIHVTHGNPDYYDNQCGSRLGQFEAAYPPGEAVNGDPTSYMATEQFKQTIRSVFNACGNYGCPAQSTGLRVYTDGWPGRAPDVDNSNALTKTGRYWRDRPNPVPSGANSRISRPGNIMELLEQVNPNGAGAILAQIRSRINQMDPTLNQDQIDNLLSNHTLELGEIAYIHKNGNGQIVIDNNRPMAMVGDVSNINDPRRTPVGRLQRVSSGGYQTLGTIVNPHNEGDIHLQLYTSMPDVATVGLAEDTAEWTAGVGGGERGIYNLGRLRFTNRCRGVTGPGGAVLSSSGEFCQPD